MPDRCTYSTSPISLRGRTLSPNARSGGALVLALVVVSMAALFASSVLQLTSSVSRGQAAMVDNTRAFYLAEAGLAEAFEALRIGLRGQIGSAQEPASYGDGFVWVDATPTPDNQMRLESTAICGRGRATLALIVEPVSVPIGIFSDEEIVLQDQLHVDSFNSSAPEEESPGITFLDASADDPYKHVDETNNLLYYGKTFYHFTSYDNEIYSVDHSISLQDLSQDPNFASQYDIEPTDFVDHVGDTGKESDFIQIEYEGVKAYFATLDSVSAETTEESSSNVTTSTSTTLDSGGALFGSNGNITVGGSTQPVSIYGDAIPGVGKQVVLGSGGYVSGDSEPRPSEVELPDVTLPNIALDSPLVQDSPIPMVLSPGQGGFEAITVAEDAELTIRGPATILVGSLTLAEGASLTLDTTDGDVELFITQSLHLEPNSSVDTPNRRPDQLTLQVAADDSQALEPAVRLQATSQFYGTVYTPNAQTTVGSNFEIWGSIAARVLELEPGAKIHYDEAVESKIPKLVSWEIVEVPAEAYKSLVTSIRSRDIDTGTLKDLTEAHDLGGITIHLDYVDAAGTQKTYSGPEEDFDWKVVREVVKSQREGFDNWEEGYHNDWWKKSGADWWESLIGAWHDQWGSNWGSNWGNSESGNEGINEPGIEVEKWSW